MPYRRRFEREMLTRLVMASFKVTIGNATVPVRTVRRLYLRVHAFEALLALSAVTTAVVFVAVPEALEQTAIGQAVHPYDFLWNAAYFIGGASILFGLSRPSPRFEALGLILLVAAVAGTGLAALVLRGAMAAGTITVYVAIIAVFLMRVQTIVRAVRLMNLEHDEAAERSAGGEERRDP